MRRALICNWPSCCGTSTPHWLWRSVAVPCRWPMPLFAALLNYRHSGIDKPARSEERKRAREGMRVFYLEERTNYPCTLTVDDVAEGFWLMAQVRSPNRADAHMRVHAYRACILN